MKQIEGIKAFDSAANFIFIRFDDSIDVQALKDRLAANGYLVRLWTEGSHLSMRITVAPKPDMDKVLELIQDFCKK